MTVLSDHGNIIALCDCRTVSFLCRGLFSTAQCGGVSPSAAGNVVVCVLLLYDADTSFSASPDKYGTTCKATSLSDGQSTISRRTQIPLTKFTERKPSARTSSL